MTTPTRKEINDVLKRLDEGEWKSDAEREGLPIVNVRDSGAPRLDVDAALGYSTLDQLKGKK